MTNLSKLAVKALVPAMILLGNFAFSQAGRGVATELWDGKSKEPTLSIPLLERYMVAIAEWSDAVPVVLEPKSKYNPKNKQDSIQPFAKVQIFVAEPPAKDAGATATAQPLQFMEKVDFVSGSKPMPFKLTFRLPAKDRTVWFQDPKNPELWYSSYMLASDPNQLYALRIDSDDYRTLVLVIDRWPAGDPTMGWGPRPH